LGYSTSPSPDSALLSLSMKSCILAKEPIEFSKSQLGLEVLPFHFDGALDVQ
jgi:hypothetical protein